MRERCIDGVKSHQGIQIRRDTGGPIDWKSLSSSSYTGFYPQSMDITIGISLSSDSAVTIVMASSSSSVAASWHILSLSDQKLTDADRSSVVSSYVLPKYFEVQLVPWLVTLQHIIENFPCMTSEHYTQISHQSHAQHERNRVIP